MYGDGEACLAGKRREGGTYLLPDGMVAVTVSSLPVVTPLMAPLSEEEAFLESKGLVLTLVVIILPTTPPCSLPLIMKRQ